MLFSVLLLTAASSKRSISGSRGSTVVMQGQLQPGEVVLFFQIDKDRVRSGLNMRGEGAKCCDGLVFRSHDDEDKKTICLVEMKTGTFNKPEDQIIETRQKLEPMLENDCRLCRERLGSIKWVACIYSHASSQIQAADCKNKLKNAGFREIIFMNQGSNDLGSFLHGESESRSSRNKRQ